MIKTLHRVFVHEFYRQNAGFFLFFFILFFGIVAPSQQLAYHYALIRGILAAPVFLAMVVIAWLLYGLRTVQYILRVIDSPEAIFLAKMNCLSASRRFWLLFRMQGSIFIPVTAYALIVVCIAVRQREWGQAVFVACLPLLICASAAGLYWHRQLYPGKQNFASFPMHGQARRRSYWTLLFRYLAADAKGLLSAIKLSSCALLYLLLRHGMDLQWTYYAFFFVLIGHNILLLRCRRFESSRLLFYRTLPVSLLQRFAQWLVIAFLLLLPELLVVAWLVPADIKVIDAVKLMSSGLTLLALECSCCVATSIRSGDLLKIWLFILGIWYVAVLDGLELAMSGLFFLAAVGLFVTGYYRLEAGERVEETGV